MTKAEEYKKKHEDLIGQLIYSSWVGFGIVAGVRYGDVCYYDVYFYKAGQLQRSSYDRPGILNLIGNVDRYFKMQTP